METKNIWVATTLMKKKCTSRNLLASLVSFKNPCRFWSFGKTPPSPDRTPTMSNASRFAATTWGDSEDVAHTWQAYGFTMTARNLWRKPRWRPEINDPPRAILWKPWLRKWLRMHHVESRVIGRNPTSHMKTGCKLVSQPWTDMV